MIGGSIILPAFSIVTRNQTFPPDYKGHFLAGFCSEENGDCVLYSELPLPAIRFRSTNRLMVVDINIDNNRCMDKPKSMLDGGGMAGQDAIEELTHGDLADLGECVWNRWVFTDEPRRERLPWHENLDWTDFYDKEVLQAWITLNAAEA